MTHSTLPQENGGDYIELKERFTWSSSHDDHFLEMVMRELAELIGGEGAILVGYPGEGAPPIALFVDEGLRQQGHEQLLQNICQTLRSGIEDGVCLWRTGPPQSNLSILMMPVERATGRSRLMIGVLFHRLTDERRRDAERLYRERRPFAVGYFHLWQANRALEQRARSFEAVLDQTTIGVLLLDSSGHVLFANRTANEILDAGDGLGRGNGAPRATHLADGVNFQAALSHTLGSSGRPAPDKTPLLAFRRQFAPPLIATLLPTGNTIVEPKDIAAVMYVVDPVFDAAGILTPLCRLYGLSPVETSLACHLAGGHTIGVAAASMHIKEQTARGYLKTIFIKTSTNRQTELVALLLSSVIRMKHQSLQEALPPAFSEAALSRFD